MTERYLSIIVEKLPAVDRIITQYGKMTLAEYVQTLIPKAIPTYQSRDDLLEIVYQYVAPLLGESIAQHVAHDLDTYPLVLTSNHHGVEYFSQTFQTRLLFALNAITNRTSAKTVLVFACGNVPLNTATYPRGLLLYYDDSEYRDTSPQKLPLFPNSWRKNLVSATPAFTQEMITKTLKALRKEHHGHHLPTKLTTTASQILKDDYGTPSVLSLANYSQQAVVLNNRIWKHLFKDAQRVPEMVFLEFEHVITALCKRDILDSQSLLWYILFEPMLREAILKELDGARACWNMQMLLQRLKLGRPDSTRKLTLLYGGTVFFWGINHARRRVPLYLETRASGDRLCGIDDFGHLWEIPFTPNEILQGLEKHTLLPSLFTCFLVLTFARGITCVGGYYQSEYLPIIQQGLITALRYFSNHEDIAHLIAKVRTNSYLDSMVAVMTKIGKDSLIPAGPVEIISGGGISNKELEQIVSLTVRDAHVADILDTFPDAVSSEHLQVGWKKQLAAESFQILQDKVLIK